MRNPSSHIAHKGAVGVLCLASAFLSGGCGRQTDGTDLSQETISSVALKPNIVKEPKEIAPGIFQVPASQWPGWLVEFKEGHPDVKITTIAPAGQAQTYPISNANTTLITSFVVVTEGMAEK